MLQWPSLNGQRLNLWAATTSDGLGTLLKQRRRYAEWSE